MHPTLRTALAAICILLITVCAALLAGKAVGTTRVADLTDENLYTLSEGTDRILDKLSTPVYLKLYYARTAATKGSDQMRFYNTYFRYVRDLLREFVRRSDGRISLEVIDPRPFSEAEQDALGYGLKRFQITEEESFFFGLVATTKLGKEEVIDFFTPDRQAFVEYDVAKTVSGLMERERKTIGVLSGLPVLGSDVSPYMAQMMRMQGRTMEEPWLVTTHLRQEYEVVRAEVADGAVDAALDYLFVIHPKELSEEQLFAVDQYLMGGGRLAVFVDPHCLQDRPEEQPGNPYAAMEHKAASDLNRLLRRWGVELIPGAIAVDDALAVKVPLRQNAPAEPFPAYLQLTGDQMSPKSIITDQLENVTVLYAGALRRTEAPGLQVEALFSTSDAARLWRPQTPFELMQPNPDAIREGVAGEMSDRRPLAVLVSGAFGSNFPDGLALPDDEDGEDEDGDAADAAEATPEDDSEDAGAEADADGGDAPAKRLPARTTAADGARLLVVADVDFMSDMIAYRNHQLFGPIQQGDNATFLLNAVDVLGGSSDLVAVRSRGRFERPFTVVERIRAEAAKETDAEIEKFNKKIQDLNAELSRLREGSGGDNAALIEKEAMEKIRRLEASRRDAEQQIRRLQNQRRQRVEALKREVRLWNLAAAPAVILLIACGLALFRASRARRYAAQRT
ncbi:MAG: Gldg family protein [Planctomycetota bacterium]